jgi:MarR family transcriptional regulator, organic hydroperoxide resistance regulator
VKQSNCDYPGHDTIGFLIGLISRAYHKTSEDALTDLGLHAGQERFLGCLWNEEGLTQSEIAQRMAVQPPTINKMLTRMEAAGMVERQQDSEDSRLSRVYLTERSHSMKDEVCGVFEEIEGQLTANMSLEERILLKRLLMQVLENLRNME